MGKPAARLGDMTVHGGVISVGFPHVLIGGKPAARVGDMHTCPMVNPGTPPPPHVGGPIMPPGAVTVLIGGMPAACVGDMATCAGPPDTIAPPGCPTVLIGPGGGGGGGGGGAGGGGGSGEAEAEGLEGGGPGEGGEAEEEEGHFLDVTFVDKGGFPITGVGYTITDPEGESADGILAGQVKRSGVKPGDYEIRLRTVCNAKWSKSAAEVGEQVKLSAKTAGIEDGTKALIFILAKDTNSPGRKIEEIEAEVSGDKVEGDWTFEVDDEWLEYQKNKKEQVGYLTPRYFFVVEVLDCSARSGFLDYKDWLEIELKDEDGQPVANKKFKAKFQNGEIREGKLDSKGCAKLEKVPPGKAEISFDLSK